MTELGLFVPVQLGGAKFDLTVKPIRSCQTFMTSMDLMKSIQRAK